MAMSWHRPDLRLTPHPMFFLPGSPPPPPHVFQYLTDPSPNDFFFILTPSPHDFLIGERSTPPHVYSNGIALIYLEESYPKIYFAKFEKILSVGYFFKDLEVLLPSSNVLLIKSYHGATYLVSIAADPLFQGLTLSFRLGAQKGLLLKISGQK